MEINPQSPTFVRKAPSKPFPTQKQNVGKFVNAQVKDIAPVLTSTKSIKLEPLERRLPTLPPDFERIGQFYNGFANVPVLPPIGQGEPKQPAPPAQPPQIKPTRKRPVVHHHRDPMNERHHLVDGRLVPVRKGNHV